MNEEEITPPKNPPAFNLPTTVLAVGAVLVAVHLLRTYAIDDQTGRWVLLEFSFIPLRYHVPLSELLYPMARFWSPFTNGLLHADWTHLLVNLVWFSAFGSAVARRFESTRFIVFLIIATGAGALAHYIFYSQGTVPMIGASGAVSACMGAAVRFAFTPGRPISEATTAPALSLLQSLANRNIMTFVVLWFALNWAFGSGIIPSGATGQIAWEAHMGGFLFGWLAFSLFDKQTKR